MANHYLNFKEANCKNCYKCLRECPVKAIVVRDDHARIDDDLCVLCGHCANVCRFNAKEVVDDRGRVRALLASNKPVVASVAPAFAASFDLTSFAPIKKALEALGFSQAEETARGAHAVTAEYKDILLKGGHKNLIASACPAMVRTIQMYYPAALPYLAMVDSPMVAHAKLLRRELHKNAAIVFIGPCIAKKREAAESGIIDAVLTFEELASMLSEDKIEFDRSAGDAPKECNRAKYYPINRGIIKSFEGFAEGYEYISVDGMTRAQEVLENIDTLSGMFIEMHACEFSCINGPAALHTGRGGFIKATEEIRAYAGLETRLPNLKIRETGDFKAAYPPLKDPRRDPPEYEIRRILEATGKYAPEDELNCGACGYATCRDKARAVYNGLAQIDMCVPYMRERAESMSYDIIQNSPNGIIAVDDEIRIIEINQKAMQLLGIDRQPPKGEPLESYYNPTDFYLVMTDEKPIDRKRAYIEKTGAWVELNIRRVKGQSMMFCTMKDITSDTNYRQIIGKLKEDTVAAADEVIAKQMRVVQEIASLLGETAAETKIALVKLKNTLKTEDERDEGGKD